jgi:HEAT repeat protein
MFNRKIIVAGSVTTVVACTLAFLGYHATGYAQPAPETLTDAEFKKQLTLIQASLVGTRAELVAAQAKLDAAEKQLAILQGGRAKLDKDPTKESREALYQGKPASYWLEQAKDLDQATTIKAMRALAALAEVDRAMIPAVIGCLEGLRTDEKFAENQSYRERGEEIVEYLVHRLSMEPKDKAALVPHLVKAAKARPDLWPAEHRGADSETIALSENYFRGHPYPVQLLQRYFEDLEAEPDVFTTPLLLLLTDEQSYIRWIGISFVGIDASPQEFDPKKAKEIMDKAPQALAHKKGRFAAACVLARLGVPDSEAAIAVLIEKGNININSLAALSSMGHRAKAAVPELKKLLSDQAMGLRAAYTLACIAPDEADAIVPVLVAKDGFNTNSLAALRVLGPRARSAIPRLIEFISSGKIEEDLYLKYHAAIVLGGFGTEAKEAVPAASKLLSYMQSLKVTESPIFQEGTVNRAMVEEVRTALEKMGHKKKSP